MRVIWKFTTQKTSLQSIEVPSEPGSRPVFLSAMHCPADGFCLWAEVESTAPVTECQILIAATGDRVPDDKFHYLATVEAPACEFWHVYIG